MLGQAVGLMEARPSYVRFETRAVERRDSEGLITFVDQDFALVTAQGSKDVTEKLLPAWFDQLRVEVRNGRFSAQWLELYKNAYKEWKETQEQPVIGTPIANWPAASPAEKKTLQQSGVRAIEDLAQANEEMIARIGMGGRSLKARAEDWVTARRDTAPIVAKMDVLRLENERLQRENLGLQDRVKALEAALHARSLTEVVSLPPVEDRVLAARKKDDSDSVVDSTIEEELNG